MTQETQQDITATQATQSPEASQTIAQPANTDSATQADLADQLKPEEVSSTESSPVPVLSSTPESIEEAEANNQNNEGQNAITSADGPAVGELVEILVPNLPLITPPPSETPFVDHSEPLHFINTEATDDSAATITESLKITIEYNSVVKADLPEAQNDASVDTEITPEQEAPQAKENTPPASPKRAQENVAEAEIVKEEVEPLKENTPPASPKQAQENVAEAGTVKEEVESLKEKTPPASPKQVQDNTPEVADKPEPKPEEVASPSKGIGKERKILSLNESVRKALSKRNIKVEELETPEKLDSEILKSIIAEMNFGDGSQTARKTRVNNSIQALIDEAKPKPPVDVEEPKAENADNIAPKTENEPTQPSELPDATSQPEQTVALETPSQKDEPTKEASTENAENKPAPLETVERSTSTSTVTKSPKAEATKTDTADTSKKLEENTAPKPAASLNKNTSTPEATTNVPHRDISSTPLIRLSKDVETSLHAYILNKIKNEKTLHRKDFFGFRSDEIEKLHIASKVSTKVFSEGFTSKIELFKFLGEQLKANTKQTGHQFASGALACILENAKNEVLSQMNPLEKARAELEDYIQKAAETQQGKRARYGFRSDQTAKLAQADLVNTLFKNRDNSVSLTDAEKQTIEKAIQANLAATTFTPGKGKGQLNSILASLLEAGSKVVTTQPQNVGP